jgi:protein-tyrosine kinase
VSRIFDMLRKSEREATGRVSATPWASNPKVRVAKESLEVLPLGFENVEHVPVRIQPDRHIVTCGENHVPGAEKFRVLRHRLQKIRADRPLTRLLVSSAVPREGKTFVAVNLAFSLAKTSRRVLLVDADLRRPGVHDVLGLEPMSGLADFLQGKIDEYAAIRRLDPSNLFYLPAGYPPSDIGDLLNGPRFREFLAKAGEAFDWVVVDTAPITLFADTPHLATLVDASLLVTRLGVTPADTIQQALGALEGSYVAGIVLNGEMERESQHYRYYSYSDEPEDSSSAQGNKEDSHDG